MKRLLFFVVLLFSVFMVPVTAAAAQATALLYLNGKQLVPEVAPRIVNGNTIVPVRIIAENIGAKVGWDGNTRKVTVTRGDTKIEMTIDNPEVLVNGKSERLEAAPTIVDGSTLLPIRFVGELLGVQFTWDEITRSVFMYQDTSSTTTDNSSSGGSDPASTSQTGSTGGSDNVNVAYAAELDTSNSPAIVQGVDFAGNRLSIQTSGVTAKPNTFRLSAPERFVIDIPNAVLGDAMKSQLVGTAGEISLQSPLAYKVRFSNFSSKPAVVRIIIDLKAQSEILPVDSKILPAGTIAYDLKTSKYKVVIDPGHGGHDSGAISITGKMEKTFTLSTASKVFALLQKEPLIEPLMTRSDDTFVALDDRVAFANSQGANLFLSIHGNKYDAATTGTETYYSRDESLNFASVVHKHIVPATGFADRGIRQEPFRVIKNTTMPAVLVEVGYLSNASDEAKMYEDAFQNQVAASLVAAIKEYLNIQ